MPRRCRLALLGGTRLLILTVGIQTSSICQPANTDPPMRLNNDKFVYVCQNIEAGLKTEYERHPDLTDERCAFALDQAKIAVKQRFGFAKNEFCKVGPDQQGIVDWCVEAAAQRVETRCRRALKQLGSSMPIFCPASVRIFQWELTADGRSWTWKTHGGAADGQSEKIHVGFDVSISNRATAYSQSFAGSNCRPLARQQCSANGCWCFDNELTLSAKSCRLRATALSSHLSDPAAHSPPRCSGMPVAKNVYKTR